jgi:DNA-binding beta-propeller fold protein YncE
MRILSSILALALLATACSGDNDASEPSVSAPVTAVSVAPIEEDQAIEPSYAGTVPAPEFPDGLDWLNTASPLQLASLQGKIVLLDFWTYGCINCIHIIPDLQRLEEEYAEELVVIGVHSAKFINEGETDNIRQVVLRYGIEHPVVNDRDFTVWQTWGAQAWPTIALIDPAGNVVGMHSGEGVYDTVEPVVASLVNEFSGGDLLDRTPIDFELENETQANTILSYPGKVATDAAGERLFISDTGHNRVVVADTQTGEIVAVFGNGTAGFASGAALTAEFNSPQGLVFDDASGTLYVADTNNHAIRAIDVATGTVETVAGNGIQGWPPAAGLLSDVRLNSPWGLTLHDSGLWVAMAGFHQIWMIDLAGGIATPAVGSALEGVANGPLVEASLAQPSGLVFDDAGRLYFADSESSSIRWADALLDDGVTGVLAGSDKNLFDFGDQDGTGTVALLQHPLGIAWDEVTGNLIIADTYNSKIKTIDPASGKTDTFLGSEQGWADGADAQFYEPGGLAITGRTLFVADTNNHVIRTVTLDTGLTTTLVLHGIENFTPPPEAADYPGTVISLASIDVGAGAGDLVLNVRLPDGYKVNEEAPSSVGFAATGGIAAFPDGSAQSLTGAKLPVHIGVELTEGAGLVTADVTLLYCRDDSEGLCIIEQVRFEQPLVVAGNGPGVIDLPYAVTLPAFADG